MSILLAQCSLQLVPFNRHRNERTCPLRSQRIGADGGFMIRVLTPIDEYLVVPKVFRHLSDDSVGVFALKHLRNRPRKWLGCVVRDPSAI